MDRLLDQLQRITPGGYAAGAEAAAEPTAWAALTLARAGRSDAANSAAQWLANQQRGDGSVPASDSLDGPYWTTSLAILAWQAFDPDRFETPIQRAVDWLLLNQGTTIPPSPRIGHNTQLVGWSWNPATHSWLEPTAFAVLALREAGYADHARTREAVELLVDRLLEDGGCNYGNTIILDQQLLPQLQPTGIVLWALAGVGLDDPRIERSLAYLKRELKYPSGCTSLAYAMLALSAWDRRPADAESLLDQALTRPDAENNPHRLSLLLLARQSAASAPLTSS